MHSREHYPTVHEWMERELTNLGTAGKAGTFDHGKYSGGDVAIHHSALVEVAAAAVHIAVNVAVDVNLTGSDIALDVSQLTDCNLAGLGGNLAVNLAINVHVIVESDGADDFDTLSQYVCGIGAHVYE